MNAIVRSQDNTNFGFIKQGVFKNRIYLFEDKFITNEPFSISEINTLNKKISHLKGYGFECYRFIIGKILSWLGFATAQKLGDKTIYVNNNSFCQYIIRKAEDKLGSYEQYKNKVNGRVYRTDTMEKVHAQWKRLNADSAGDVELTKIISDCVLALKEEKIKAKVKAEIKANKSSTPLQLEIKRAVDNFLFPYITNQIQLSPEEEANRAPLMETLLAELKQKYGENINEKEVEAFTLEAYISCAARGLYINLKWLNADAIPAYEDLDPATAMQLRVKIIVDPNSYQNEMINKWSELLEWLDEWHTGDPSRLPSLEFLILLQALNEALHKDFPKLTVSPAELMEMAEEGLEHFNQQRKATLESVENDNMEYLESHSSFKNNWALADDPLKAYLAQRF